MISISGYNINNELRCDRNDTAQGRGGGLLVYTRNGINVTPIDCEIMFNQYVVFELKCIGGGNTARNFNLKLNIILFYRSPNSDAENTERLVSLLNRFKKNSIFIGDLNLPRIEWNQGLSDSKGRSVLECTDNNGQTQLITFPTHIGGNILDVVLTDRPELCYDIYSAGNIGNSDHVVICLELLVHNKCENENVLIRDWHNCDSRSLTNHLRYVDWDRSLGNCTGKEVWNKFDTIVQNALDLYVPMIQRNYNSRPHWLNKNCKRVSNTKRRLFRIYLKNKTQANYERYKEAEKICTRTIRNAKKRYEKKLAQRNDKRCFSTYVKSRSKLKESIGPLKVNGVYVHDDDVMCQELNKFFASVFTRENTDTLPDFENLHDGIPLDNLVITPDMIRKEVINLKPSMSAGPGGYSNKFIKEYIHVLAEPLSIVYNELLNSGEVPDSWKLAHVIPIFKKGSKGDPGNYRPVSLTCVMGKLFERVLKTSKLWPLRK